MFSLFLLHSVFADDTQLSKKDTCYKEANELLAALDEEYTKEQSKVKTLIDAEEAKAKYDLDELHRKCKLDILTEEVLCVEPRRGSTKPTCEEVINNIVRVCLKNIPKLVDAYERNIQELVNEHFIRLDKISKERSKQRSEKYIICVAME